jgi:hypothetical protein
MKTGVKTSEFWITLVAVLISTLLGNLTPEASANLYAHIDKYLAIIAPIVGAFGYTISRGLAKMNQKG